MPRRREKPATELVAAGCFGEGCELVLRPGTASGFKGVRRLDSKTWEARTTVDGKTQHIWSSKDPRECAIYYALFKEFPVDLPNRIKERGKWTYSESAEEADRIATMRRQQQRVLQETGYLCSSSRGADDAKDPAAKRVCPVDRLPLSPVKNK